MAWRRNLALALLLYLVGDYSDPSLPGVFSFDTKTLYVDGALDGRAQPLKTPQITSAPPVAAEGRLETARPERNHARRLPVVRTSVPVAHARTVPALSSDDRTEDH